MTERAAQAPQETVQGYVSPIDFAALEEMNEDIYAWLYIPGTEINHPILQSVRGDNDYYLDHTVDHLEDENGCLFTEYLYNSKDFDVPVTVIYGHRRRTGDMFGQLQELYAVSTGGSALRLRDYPGQDGAVLAMMPNGAAVQVYGEWQGWYVVHYNGLVGYAAAAYIAL